MRRLSLSLILGSASLAAAVFACGGISDPTRNGSERVATISGALTGTSVPANARVALVWRKGTAGGPEVGADVPVVAGNFTMNLTTPPDAYFAPMDAREVTVVGNEPPSMPDAKPDQGGSTDGTGGAAPAPSGGSGSGGKAAAPFAITLSPRDTVSGGVITQPLNAALAGFIVYVDTNGNDKLDLSGQYGASIDTVLGGNEELILVNLKGGGALDLEKLRDKSGILPTQGFNLAWDRGRWLALDLVELKLSAKEGLPSEVCGRSGGDHAESSASGSAPTGPTLPPPPSGGDPRPYPAPGSPGLECSPDGRSFTYSQPCPSQPPPPVGVCAGSTGPSTSCAGGYGTRLASDQPVPAGWPCPVTEPADGGPAPNGDSGRS